MKHIFKSLAIAALALSATACQSEAKKAVSEQLNDAQSAKWKDVTSANILLALNPRYTEQPSVKGACGYVNAKNGFGAYTGFTPFIYLGGDNPEAFIYTQDDDFAHAWNLSCRGMGILPVSPDFAWRKRLPITSRIGDIEYGFILKGKAKAEELCFFISLKDVYARTSENKVEIDSAKRQLAEHNCQSSL